MGHRIKTAMTGLLVSIYMSWCTGENDKPDFPGNINKTVFQMKFLFLKTFAYV